jgi:hypothetical protein
MKRNALTIILILISVFILTVIGCGGGGGGAGDSTPNPDTEIPETTKVLSTQTMSTISTPVSDNQVVFEGSNKELDDLEPNDIIVAEPSIYAPDGLLRKVVSVSKSGDETIVWTTEASLVDAITNGTLSQKKVEATIADIRSFTPAPEVDFETIPTGTISGHALQAMIIDENLHFQVYTSPNVVIDGSFKLPDLLYDVDITIADAVLDYMAFTVNILPEANLSFTVSDAFEFSPKPIPLGTMQMSPTIFWIGYVPVVIVPQIDLYIGCNGTLECSVTSDVTAGIEIVTGLSYQNGIGWEVINDTDSQVTYNPPSLSATANFKVWAGPRVSLLLYGIAGPYGALNGFSQVEADVNADPWWNLSWGITGVIGVDLSKISPKNNDPNYEVDLYGPKTIGSADGPFFTTITTSIVSPTNGSVYDEGDYIQFSCSMVSGGSGSYSYSWSSSIDSVIGTQNQFETNLLSVGIHTVLLEVTDNFSGDKFSQAVTFEIVGNQNGGSTIGEFPEYTADPSDVDPLVIVQTSPTNGSIGISTDTNIVIYFDDEVNPGTISDTTIKLTDSTDQQIYGFISGEFSTAGNTIMFFDPVSELDPGSTYTITLTNENGIKDDGDNNLSTTYVISFTTAQSTVSPSDLSFEKGDEGWLFAGDGSIVTAVGAIYPTSGTYMAAISTGSNFGGTANSDTTSILTSGPISLNYGQDQLVFDYDFLSSEFDMWVVVLIAS